RSRSCSSLTFVVSGPKFSSGAAVWVCAGAFLPINRDNVSAFSLPVNASAPASVPTNTTIPAMRMAMTRPMSLFLDHAPPVREPNHGRFVVPALLAPNRFRALGPFGALDELLHHALAAHGGFKFGPR